VFVSERTDNRLPANPDDRRPETFGPQRSWEREPAMTAKAIVSQKAVASDETGMRLDRWFKMHYPGLGFGQLQKLLRSGQIRVDGGRVKTNTRLAVGQTVRVPPIGESSAPKHQTMNTIRDRDDRTVIEEAMLYEDDLVMVINKPAGLAVQGGSGLNRHVDGMLEAFRDRKGQKPRLVHRIDRDTSGILVIAKTRKAAADLSVAFRSRTAKKVYWALLRGLPKPLQGRISTYMARGEGEEADRMNIVKHGDNAAQHSVSLYSVVEHAGQAVAWVAMKPVTGRTHQLRAHAAHIGHHRRPEIFQCRELGIAGRHTGSTASPGATDSAAASERRHPRRDRAAAAAYAAILGGARI